MRWTKPLSTDHGRGVLLTCSAVPRVSAVGPNNEWPIWYARHTRDERSVGVPPSVRPPRHVRRRGWEWFAGDSLATQTAGQLPGKAGASDTLVTGSLSTPLNQSSSSPPPRLEKNRPLRSWPITPEIVFVGLGAEVNLKPVDGWLADQTMVALLSMNLPVTCSAVFVMRVSVVFGLPFQRTSNDTNDGIGGMGGFVTPAELKMSM
jgi:hypothetical protein